MSESFITTPLRDLFKFPFQGDHWRNNFIVGTILILASFWMPIIPLIFILGYLVPIMRQGIEGQELYLPPWTGWGELGRDGLRMLLVGGIYLLPSVVIFLSGFLVYFVILMALPVILASSGADLESREGLGFFLFLILGGGGILLFSLFVGSLLWFISSIPLPAAMAHFVAQDKLSAAFRVREWWPLLATNKLGYFIAWVIVFGTGTIFYVVTTLTYYTLILVCILPLLVAPFMFYWLLISSALFGQTYRESRHLVVQIETPLMAEKPLVAGDGNGGDGSEAKPVAGNELPVDSDENT